MFKVLAISIIALICVAVAKGNPSPPPRRAYPAHRKVFWVCPMDQKGYPVTKPLGVCIKDFWP